MLQKIAKGPDGALWFTDGGTNSIGKITTAGVITEYTVPTASAAPYGIAPGGDGNLWFTEFNTGNVGSITTGGTVTEYAGTASTNNPAEMAQAADGTVWFAEQSGTSVGHVVMSVTSGRYLVITQNTPTLTVTSGTTATFTCAITNPHVRLGRQLLPSRRLGLWHAQHGNGHVSGRELSGRQLPLVGGAGAFGDVPHVHEFRGARPVRVAGIEGPGPVALHRPAAHTPTTMPLQRFYNAAITYKTDGSATPSGLATTWGTQTINFKVVVQ